MQRLIIGDIHGCHTELRELLDRTGIAEDTEIIALGDILDRGPDSPQVFDYLAGRPRTISLMGNHERKHVRSFRGETAPALSQLITRHQFGEERYPAVCAKVEAFPRFIELPEAILVHGFLEPNIALSDQREQVLVGTLSGEYYLREHYGRPWYELYDGSKPVIVGHHDYLGTGQPLVYNDLVYGLDTNCCRGGALTGLVLPEFRLVSVPSRANHWQEMRERYRTLAESDRPRHSPEEIRRILNTLFEYVLAENARVLLELRASSAYETVDAKQQGVLYANRIGNTPLARYLHLARKGQLTLDRLGRTLTRPAEVIELAQQAGLLEEEGEAGSGSDGATEADEN